MIIKKLTNEKLLTLGNKSDFGNILILAGGGGSGKDWSYNNILGFKGRMVNVDDISAEISQVLQKDKSSKFSDQLISFIDQGVWKEFADSDKFTQEYMDDVKRRLKADRDADIKEFFDGKNPLDVSLRYRFVNWKDYHNVTQRGVAKAANKDRLPNIIVNTTLGQYKKIDKVGQFAREFGYDPKNIHIVWVLTPLPDAIDRNHKRTRSISDTILTRGHEAVYKTFRKIFGLDPLSDTEKVIGDSIDGEVWVVFARLEDTGVITKTVPDIDITGKQRTDKDGKPKTKDLTVITSYTACRIKDRGEPIKPITEIPNLPLQGGKTRSTVGDLLSIYTGGNVAEMREYTEAKARNVRKVKAALSGKNDLIKTWGIITAENPIGVEFPDEINAKRDAALRSQLAQNNIEYIKVKGQYGSPENSLFIINPALSDLEKIASKFGQESFIFAQNSNGEDFSFDAGYYEMDIDEAKKVKMQDKLKDNPEYKLPTDIHYKKSYTKKNIIDQKDAEDFFTSIDTHGRKFKFQIPFFEATIRRAYERVSLKTEGKDRDRVQNDLMRTTIDADQYAPSSRWRIRGSLYHVD